MSFVPCWAQVVVVRRKTHAAPTLPLSPGPPISAYVLLSTSSDSATLAPNWPAPVSSLPVSFGPCWLQVEPERRKTHAAPTRWLSRGTADQRVRAFFGERHALAEFARAGLFFARELRALLGPFFARAGEDPRRADAAVVVVAADQRGVAVGGQRHAVGEVAFFAPAARELFALLDERVDPQRVARTARVDAQHDPPGVERKPAVQYAPPRVGRRQAAVAERGPARRG